MLNVSKICLCLVIVLFFNSTCLGKSNNENAKTEQISVLFVGNSLTYFNNMPQLFKNLATASGKDIYVDEATISGTPLRNMKNNSYVISKINEKKWNYIILQSDDITAFPDMYQIEINTLNSFKDIIYNNNPTTRIIYTMIWGLRDGVKIQELNGQNVYYSYETYMKKIYKGTITITDNTGLLVAPVGVAWYLSIIDDEANKNLLFDSDGAHPSLNGSYLMACVMNALIFKNNNTVIEYYSTLAIEKARYYQQKAVESVFKGIESWNVSTKIDLIDKSNSMDNQDLELKNVYPNPVTDKIQIDFWIKNDGLVILSIYDSKGNVIKSFFNRYLMNGNHSFQFDTNITKCGFYFIQLKYKNQTRNKKIVISK